MSDFFSYRIGLRFLRSKRYGTLARFMSLASTIGIAVGVCALIVGLSAMNGFETELKNRVLSLIPSAQLKSEAPYFKDIDNTIKILEESPDILAAAPVYMVEGVLTKSGSFAPAAAIGIVPDLETKVVDIERFMNCRAEVLNTDRQPAAIIVGQGIARKLHLQEGDLVDLISSNGLDTQQLLSKPVSASFKVAGLFSTGGQIDSTMAFIHINDAMDIASVPAPNTIHLRTADILQARRQVYNAAYKLSERANIESWMTTQGKLYNDIQMIRGIMYIAMFLVMAVACFNIIANLIMSVSEKSREIAILLTMGATPKQIVKAFTFMGIMSGLRGSLIGVVLGCLISCLLAPVTSHFKDWFGFSLLNEEVYFINFIPSKLSVYDCLLVLFCALLMSLLASLYPAVKASRIAPAKELSI
ncbi:MAG: lipoprotein-releasing ABC transporter permease subunit [Succinivibrio sp.]|nr:lipoprotein-releasing ABC transporter permease subunit [Succinivibrio sp.]